jgi:cyclophilin family peptidyl-prolyl cis-trans isomerase
MDAAGFRDGGRGARDEANNYSGTGNPVAVMETSMGTIHFELYMDLVPITTENFIDLAKSNFYNGIYFHRVIDDFVVQGGDPNTLNMNPCDDGWGGSQDTIPLEIHDNLTHVDGAVGMARSSDPDSASSQFYLCDGPQHHLDGDYAVFALVMVGMEVVRSIAAVDTYPSWRPCLKDHPQQEVTILNIDVVDGDPYMPTTEDGGNGTEGGKGGEGSPIPFPSTFFVLGAVCSAVAVINICEGGSRRH